MSKKDGDGQGKIPPPGKKMPAKETGDFFMYNKNKGLGIERNDRVLAQILLLDRRNGMARRVL